VNIRNVDIGGGLFYCGDRLLLPDGQTTQYAINARLPISESIAEITGRTLPARPSYAEMSPAARRAFLDWMASGRKDPAYGIGHVFLFLFGLEHRVFVEKGSDTREIIAEVERLLAVYRGNRSFRVCATTFLNFARISAGIRPAPQPLSPQPREGEEPVLGTRLAMGEILARNPALSAEDALRWVLGSRDTYIGIPFLRCFEEFLVLWKLRFARQFPDGCVVDVKSRISLPYQAASGAFEVEVPGLHQHHPDPDRATEELDLLRKLYVECSKGLADFSRWVGRRPSERRSMAAVAVLPVDLRRLPEFAATGEFRPRIEAIINGEQGGMTRAAVLYDIAGIEVPGDGMVSEPVFSAIARALADIDVAIEPDPRYGTGVPHADEWVQMFPAQSGALVMPGQAEFRAMRAQVEVAVVVAGTDRDSCRAELERMIARIEKTAALDVVEQARLIAFAATAFNNPPKQASMLRRIADLNIEEREAVADAAIAVAGSSLPPDPDEVRFLERLHVSLGLSKKRLYARLHRAADAPVALTEEKRVPGIALRKRGHRAGGKIAINGARLEQTRLETETAAALLAGIFSGEEAGATPAAVPATPLSGLDQPHLKLLERLETRGAMSRSEFERVARAVGLLPDGAIEHINDWSFDRFDEPLIEDGDEVALHPHLRAQLAAMRNT